MPCLEGRGRISKSPILRIVSAPADVRIEHFRIQVYIATLNDQFDGLGFSIAAMIFA
jgi:hypothetical protein